MLTHIPAELLIGSATKTKNSGQHLLRKGPKPGETVLSILFKGKPSHHTLAQDAPGGVFNLNGINTKQTSFATVRLNAFFARYLINMSKIAVVV